MERRLGLLVALAITGAGCAADDGGGSTLNSRDPVTMEDGGVNGGGNGGGNGASNGAANGGNGGASNGASAGNNGPEICEEITVRADKVIPDILIVLDKSGSMVFPGCAALDVITAAQLGCPNAAPPYNAPFDRWVPSVAALKTTTETLQERVRFGLMIFPDPDLPAPNIFAQPVRCQPGTVRVAPSLNTAAEIATRLDAEVADGSATPIPSTLKAAHAALGTGIVGPDKMPTPKYVLFVTDGEPTCMLNGKAPANDAEYEMAKQQSYAEIDSLAKDGIKTYVVGYDTSSTPSLAATLDEMAKRGGTGEMTHREVTTDPNSLVSAIEAIAGQVTSCTFQLDQAPPDVKKIRVTLDGVDRANGDGWELTGDRTIELRGQACSDIQDINVQHTLTINVECKDVIIE